MGLEAYLSVHRYMLILQLNDEDWEQSNKRYSQ